MEVLRAYLYRHRKLLLCFMLGCGVFLGTFSLYDLPLAVVLYPAALCLTVLLIFGTVGYCQLKKQHRLLQKLADTGEAALEQLPEDGSLEGADYRAIITALQKQLEAERQEARRRYSDMMDYYTVWAHQIKTPIAAMNVTLQSEDSPLSRQLTTDLNRVEQYADMVLTYLRLDSESTDYVFHTCQLDALIRQAVRRFSGEFIGRRLRLAYEPVGVDILTDEKWLTFVLEQLLSNALKYTREGTISIYAEKPLTLCVADTGIGIASEDLPRIFERGYTGRNGRTDSRATGIGLYLCRRICDKLGIGISASSEVGKGTVIRLDLSQYPLRVE